MIVSVVTPDAVSIKTWVPSFSTKLLLERVGAGRAGYVGVIMPVLALLISTVFENLEWQQDLIIGLPILIIGAVLVINQKIIPIK